MSAYYPANSSVGQQRMDSLKETMQGIASMLSTAQETPRWQTLQALLDCLQTFADEQFNYVLNAPAPSGPTLKYPRYPREFGLAVTLAQIAHDLEAIERAAHQRMVGTPAMLNTLRRADQLAYLALLPARDSLLKESGLTVLTYFQKSPAIRVIPYAPLALIGVPFSCISTAQDFLAIPHEAGHYVYWHGSAQADGADLHIFNTFAKKIFEQNSSLLKKYGHWIEEIFADVYGCRIAGPMIALSFQDLQLNRSQEQFEKDDGDHPEPILRPDIYTRALEKMNLDEVADSLSDRWLRRKGQRGYTLEDEVRFNDKRRDVNRVIDVADALLESVNDPKNWWRLAYEKAIASFAGEPENLYPAFAAEIGALSLNQAAVQDPPELDATACKSAGVLRQTVVGEEKAVRVVRRSVSDRYGPLTDEELEWVAVLSAGGWTTEGPNGTWP